jgi:hypothetical protein
MKTTLIWAGLLVTVLSGCASILNDETQPINVSASNNKEVSGSIDGQTFKTPAVVNVTRENKNKVIAVSTEGCAKETSLEKSVDSKFFINILSGGLLGSSTDYGTEEMWRYSENVVIQCQ